MVGGALKTESLCFAVDNFGSMSENSLLEQFESLEQLEENVNENDLFSLFDGEPYQPFWPDTPPETPVSYTNSIRTTSEDSNLSANNLSANYASSQLSPQFTSFGCFRGNEPLPPPATPNVVSSVDSFVPTITSTTTASLTPVKPRVILPKANNNNSNNKSKKSTLSKAEILEARRQRNRESALNSRLKKEQYVDRLKSDMTKLETENQVLRNENTMLKQKVSQLEGQLQKLSDVNGNFETSSNKKIRISYFAIFVMVFFQVSPYIVPMSSDTNSKLQSPLGVIDSRNVESRKIGRNLLWSSGNASADDYDDALFAMDGYNNNNNNTGKTRCNEFVNKTESARLENELRDWLRLIGANERLDKWRQIAPNNLRTRKRLLYDAKHVPIPRLKTWMKQKYDVDDDGDDLRAADFDQLPGGERFNPATLLGNIHRRDDTFYYLARPTTRHLILSPVSNRTDVRPRFTFLIPSVYDFSLSSTKNLNTTTNAAHRNTTAGAGAGEAATESTNPRLFLLQIDCQVINTKVTQIEQKRKKTKRGP